MVGLAKTCAQSEGTQYKDAGYAANPNTGICTKLRGSIHTNVSSGSLQVIKRL